MSLPALDGTAAAAVARLDAWLAEVEADEAIEARQAPLRILVDDIDDHLSTAHTKAQHEALLTRIREELVGLSDY